MAKVLDCSLEVSKINYIHFRTKTLGKAMNLFFPQSYGFFYNDGFAIK